MRPSLALAGVPCDWCHALAMAAVPRRRLTMGPGPGLPVGHLTAGESEISLKRPGLPATCMRRWAMARCHWR